MIPSTPYDMVGALHRLLAAEASAEADAVTESEDLEQAVWLRLLEHVHSEGPPRNPAPWLVDAVRTEARRLRRATRNELPYTVEPADDTGPGPENLALAAARRRALNAAVRGLSGRCARLVAALLSPRDLTYREIAVELGISQGSIGPERSRCLACLRRLLAAEVAAHDGQGKE